MAEEKDLVHILRLLDDESASVRDRVWEALETNLPAWESGIRARLEDMPPAQRKRVRDLLDQRSRQEFRLAWGRWRKAGDAAVQLENALSSLSDYLAGRPSQEGQTAPGGSRLTPLLDALAGEFRKTRSDIRPTSLARFLFVEKGLGGAAADYFDPGNSDLVRVLENGRGVPISLACVFILTGHRLGLAIAGCDVPEHFLTRASEAGEEVIIDCCDRGSVLGRDRLGQLELKYAPDFFRLLRAPASTEAIVARILRNLINAYHLSGNRPAGEFMRGLAEDLRGV